MKILLQCGLLICLVVAIGFSSSYYLLNCTESLLKESEKLSTDVSNNHWQKAEKQLGSIHKKWEKEEQVLSLLINHQEIDNIELTLGRLESYITNQSKVLSLGEISALQHWLKHIPRKEGLDLANIF